MRQTRFAEFSDKRLAMHAAGGPGADDDVVELAIELGRCAAQAGPPKGLSSSLGASVVALAVLAQMSTV